MNGEQPTVDSAIRNAVLKNLFAPKPTAPTSNSPIIESTSNESNKEENFDVLIQKVIENQEKQRESEVSQINETKDKVIKNLRMDILEDLHF